MYLIKIYWMAWYEYILYDRNTTCVGRGFVDLAMALLVFLYNNVYICFFCGEDISIIIKIELFNYQLVVPDSPLERGKGVCHIPAYTTFIIRVT